MEKKLIDQYVDTLNSLKADGSIQDFSIKQIQESGEESVTEIVIFPKHGVMGVKTNFTVTKDGVIFDDKKKR